MVAVPPQAPRIVLFEPIVMSPEMVPLTTMTRAVVPPAAELSALALVTVVDEAVPPPVVDPPCIAQPKAALSSGQVAAVVQLPALQNCRALQVVPQVPQFALSFWVSVQVVPQSLPVEHVH